MFATLLATTAPAVAEGLETDTTIVYEFKPANLRLVKSNTPIKSDARFDTDDFKLVDNDDFNAVEVLEDLKKRLQAFVAALIEKAKIFDAALDTPFGTIAKTASFDNGLEVAFQAFVNSDLFIGFEASHQHGQRAVEHRR